VKKNPVFFIGMPRSGTTIVFEIFSRHEEVAFISNYSNKFLKSPYNNLAHRIFGGRLGEKDQGQGLSFLNKFLPHPIEGYAVWEKLAGREFRDSILDFPAEPSIQRRVRDFSNKIVKAQGKDRFVAKFTGPPRIRFLNSIFPDATFVEIVRDPRAVVSSLIEVDFWKPERALNGYWNGLLSNKDLGMISTSGNQMVTSTALQWRRVREQVDIEKKDIASKRYFLIKYEDLMKDPTGVIDHLSSSIGLVSTEGIGGYLSKRHFTNMNYKYEKRLTPRDILTVEDICKEQMSYLNYKL